MTEYKWQNFKALSLPSSILCLLLNITFHFFLITHSSVLNSFHTLFFTLLFFDLFLFSQNPSSIIPIYFLPLLFHLISLLSFYMFSPSPLTHFSTYPLAYSSVHFPHLFLPFFYFFPHTSSLLVLFLYPSSSITRTPSPSFLFLSPYEKFCIQDLKRLILYEELYRIYFPQLSSPQTSFHNNNCHCDWLQFIKYSPPRTLQLWTAYWNWAHFLTNWTYKLISLSDTSKYK